MNRPEPRGKFLRAFDEGEAVRIFHVEDEPTEVYAQLVAAGLFPGTTVRILRSTPERIVVEKEGKSIELTMGLAANISAVRVPTTQFKRSRELLPHDRGAPTASFRRFHPPVAGSSEEGLWILELSPERGSRQK